MSALSENFLNNEEILEHCYRRINIPKLLSLLMRTSVNILIIGKKECWLVNASTPHPRHFVGTQCN